MKKWFKMLCNMFIPIPKETALALIQTESSGKVQTETAYARGLMGVSKPALEDVKQRFNLPWEWKDMFNPEANIDVGSRYFYLLLKYWQRWLAKCKPDIDEYFCYALAYFLADMSYNWGIGNVKRWLTDTPPDNSKIDEAVPNETKAHLFDHVWWAVYAIRKGRCLKDGVDSGDS